jgi:hypothetical protein
MAKGKSMPRTCLPRTRDCVAEGMRDSEIKRVAGLRLKSELPNKNHSTNRIRKLSQLSFK